MSIYSIHQLINNFKHKIVCLNILCSRLCVRPRVITCYHKILPSHYSSRKITMANYHKPESKTIQELKDIANKLRIDSINATQASKSG